MSQDKVLIQRLTAAKVVPVVVVEHADDILPIGDALAENGLPVAEITFRTACAAQAIQRLKHAHPEILVGAGTLKTATQIRQAIDAGAEFAVSAGINARNITFCQQHQFPIIPGINNPMGIELAIELGLDFVKFFPAEASGGIPMLKALSGPYPEMHFMPTGGVGLENINNYLDLSNVVACGGSWMLPTQLIKDKQWQKIGELIRQAVQHTQG